MTTTSDVIRGVVKLDNFLDDTCFKSWKEFVLSLPQLLTVEIPSSITNVTVGNVQPSDDERDNLWFRQDNSGSFLGLYLFAKNAWKQIYPVPQELTLISGDSRTPPDGFTFAENLTDLSVDQIAVLKKSWHVGGTVPTTWYDLFHVRYTGF